MKKIYWLVPLALALSACEPELGPAGLPVAGEGELECGAAAAPIAALQGRGGMSPVIGELVEVEARIAAKFIDGLGGFFLRSAEEDVDPASSEGIFVRHSERLAAKSGARIRVRAQVAELGEAPDSMTALIEVRAIKDCGDQLAVTPRVIDSVMDWEQVEGELVHIAGPVTLTDNFSLLRHGQIGVSFDGRDFVPTERHPPGPEARALAEANRATRLMVDDGRLDEYPSKLWHLPAPLTADSPYRADSELRGLTGVIEQRDGGFRIQLTRGMEGVQQAPRPQDPPEVDGDLRVAAFNTLNFFNGDGRGGGFPTERGARSGNALKRQRDKLVATIDRLDADVLALMEIENDGFGPESAIEQLTAAINKARGKDRGDYAFVRPQSERIGDDLITVALLYRRSRVEPVGEAAIYTEGPFSGPSRAPLAQNFRSGDFSFIVVANHFKSKRCDGGGAADRDLEDGQGCFNGTRTESARLLLDWLATDPTGSGHDRVLLLGDLNAYGNEDPLRLMASRGFVDVISAHVSEPAWSYVFLGESGRLDHALASASLAPAIGGAGEWHINADESVAFEYHEPDRDRSAQAARYRKDPYRSSDHDPLLVGLRFDTAAQNAPVP